MGIRERISTAGIAATMLALLALIAAWTSWQTDNFITAIMVLLVYAGCIFAIYKIGGRGKT